jgi:hypothetical protein
MLDAAHGAGSAEPDRDREDDLAGMIRGQVHGYVENKADAARAVTDIADALRSSGAGFAGYPHVKAFFDNAAEGVDEFSGEISRRSFNEVCDEIEAGIRRRPGVTVAAAALVGFALFRFYRASEIRPIPRSHAVVPVDVFPTPEI